MCVSASLTFPGTSKNSVSYHKSKSKTLQHLRIPRLTRRRRRSRRLLREDQREEKEMEINNWKLYIENQIIIQENEKLRKKALLLHQENQALMFLLHGHNNKPSHESTSSHQYP